MRFKRRKRPVQRRLSDVISSSAETAFPSFLCGPNPGPFSSLTIGRGEKLIGCEGSAGFASKGSKVSWSQIVMDFRSQITGLWTDDVIRVAQAILG